MKKINLRDIKPNIYLASTINESKQCYCNGCAICLACIIFAPIVGAVLAPSVAVNYTGLQAVSS